MDKAIQEEIADLKKIYKKQISEASSLETLTGKKIVHHYPINFWELSDNELDQEMGKRSP